MRDSSTLTDSPVPGSACRYYPARSDVRSHVLIGQWTTAALRMTCLTGGRTPCGAATGIPGRPATSSSPTCRARAVLTKASPGTPWSTTRQTAAAQPGTARDTTRPTRRPPPPPGSQAGSHRHPTQGDPEPTEAVDITAITSHPATAADTSRLAGSRSHRGGQGFKSPQLHRVLAGQRPISCSWASTVPMRVRFWERFGSGSCLASRLARPAGHRGQARWSVVRAGFGHGVRFPSALAMLP